MSDASHLNAAPAKPRLLVVDDEAAILRLLEALLSRAGCEVVSCDSAQRAIELLGTSPFDCVITDAVMPVMTGYELVEAVRGRLGMTEIPVLMLTRKRHRQDVKRAVEVGVTDYIFKPIDEQLLLSKIEAWVKRSGRRRSAIGEAQGEAGVTELSAELGVGCKVVSIRDARVTMRLACQPEPGAELRLRGAILREIGIAAPKLRMLECARALDPGHQGYPFQATLEILGLSDEDRARLLAWQARG